MKFFDRNNVKEYLHGFFMEFADWLTSAGSRGHVPPFLWIAAVTGFPAALAIPIADKYDGWAGLIAGFIGFGAVLVFFCIIVLAVISRIYSNQKNQNE